MGKSVLQMEHSFQAQARWNLECMMCARSAKRSLKPHDSILGSRLWSPRTSGASRICHHILWGAGTSPVSLQGDGGTSPGKGLFGIQACLCILELEPRLTCGHAGWAPAPSRLNTTADPGRVCSVYVRVWAFKPAQHQLVPSLGSLLKLPLEDTVFFFIFLHPGSSTRLRR